MSEARDTGPVAQVAAAPDSAQWGAAVCDCRRGATCLPFRCGSVKATHDTGRGAFLFLDMKLRCSYFRCSPPRQNHIRRSTVGTTGRLESALRVWEKASAPPPPRGTVVLGGEGTPATAGEAVKERRRVCVVKKRQFVCGDAEREARKSCGAWLCCAFARADGGGVIKRPG